MDPSASLTAPHAIRKMIREGDYSGPTIGFVPGFTQCNIIILPKEYAYDFLQFCHLNPDACSLMAYSDSPGSYTLGTLGKDIDIRTDIPRYRVFKNGQLIEDVHDLSPIWQADLVTFALASYLSYDYALNCAGLKSSAINPLHGLPLYISTLPCKSAGIFSGFNVVSMRPFTPSDLVKAIQIGALNRSPHGLPVHFGEPKDIGIYDLNKPVFGEPIDINKKCMPVFWTSNMTAQLAITKIAPKLCIINSPEHLLVTDQQDVSLAIK
ncbi:D-glutamate cyclase family protein [Pseudoalteromonas aurantia]|uniref:DUF1445 domain-containing protein n=1 Tax=Pseudoalteromonas aurantia 208 TaxID=1314867 RepID=A0ABR9EJ30_9GAMM|nr:DUF1445 domain-containing protein [Pseudoalteromonas aurantia]MBE0370250.1 hypothetical protein [Pseudoalteromonas aurantia 208]